jgi:hypothetical protein
LGNRFLDVELHVRLVPVEGKPAPSRQFRVFTHRGNADELEYQDDSASNTDKECFYVDGVEDAELLYASFYNKSVEQGYRRVELLASSKIGSDKAKLMGNRIAQGPSSLSGPVQRLVEYLYQEANNRLADCLKGSLGTLSLAQVEKGETILVQLYKIFQEKADGDEAQRRRNETIASLSKEFYSAIPQKEQQTIDSMPVFDTQQELVQLLKDMLTVDETTGDTAQAEVDMKYRALRCAITAVAEESEEFATIKNKVFTNNFIYFADAAQVLNNEVKNKGSISVKNVFKIRRDAEHQQFANNISNQQLLFHGSRISNWVSAVIPF